MDEGRARGGEAQWRRSETSFPTAWLPPGHEPGAGGVAQLPSSKKGGPSGLRTFGSTTRPVVAAEPRRNCAATSAHACTRLHGAHGSVTARTARSQRTRIGHGAHALVHSALPSVTARAQRSRRAQIGHSAHASAHGAHASVTARSQRSRRARIGHGVHGSVTARTPRCTARTPRSQRARCGHGAHASVTACTSRSLCARRSTASTVSTAGPAASATRLSQRAQRSGWRSGGGRGQLRAAQASPVAMAISVAQAGDSRAGGTSTARG